MSPKNKGKQGKDEIPETDEFLSGVERVVETLRPHAKPLAAVGALAVIAIVAWSIWDWYVERQRSAATEAFAEARSLAEAPVVDPEAPDAPPGAPAALSFDSRPARSKAVVDRLQKVRGEYSSVGVADLARLEEARHLYETGDHAAAAKLWKEVASSDAPPLLRVTARENLGYALEAQALASEDPAQRQQGLEAALDAFTAMQPDTSGPRGDYAQYHRGRILAELGRTDEAIEALRAVLSQHPQTVLEPDVENRLAALGADD